MEEVFGQLPKMKYYYVCKLCICTHGIKNDFMTQSYYKLTIKKVDKTI